MTYKEKAELMALRRRVETQREEIRRLQAEKPDSITVGQLLAAIHIFEEKHGADALLHIAADGRVDPGEEARYKETVRDLHGIVQAALQIDYAEKGGSA